MQGAAERGLGSGWVVSSGSFTVQIGRGRVGQLPKLDMYNLYR
jgi:hypothetical protein